MASKCNWAYIPKSWTNAGKDCITRSISTSRSALVWRGFNTSYFTPTISDHRSLIIHSPLSGPTVFQKTHDFTSLRTRLLYGLKSQQPKHPNQDLTRSVPPPRSIRRNRYREDIYCQATDNRDEIHSLFAENKVLTGSFTIHEEETLPLGLWLMCGENIPLYNQWSGLGRERVENQTKTRTLPVV